MLTSFLIFFILFTGVGIGASFFRKNTLEDYFLAGRDVPAWQVALSYGATISSGATFIGFAGLSYSAGLTALYAISALMIGDHIGWIIAGNKIRQKGIEKQTHTYPSLVGRLGDKDQNAVTVIAALLTVVFMGTYCAAQLIAGAKIGAALFDWNYTYFVFAGAGVLLAYCWAGGIRASIWTDAVQSIIIFVSLLVLIVVALEKIGGLPELYAQVKAIDPGLIDPFQGKFIAVAVGWIAFGIGVLGQPQLMVRHMVARSDKDLLTARRIYLAWRWAVLLLAVLTGFIARVLIPAGTGFDPELSIPALWEDLLPPVWVGLLIAGLFSATMSTADSLLLASSSAFTQHIVPRWKDSYMLARLGTLIVMSLIVAIALLASKGVLSLVIVAWGGMAATVAPLVAVQLLGGRPSEKTALTMIGAGLAVTLLWRYGLGWHVHLLGLVPGMMTAFAVFGGSHLLQKTSRIKNKNEA